MYTENPWALVTRVDKKYDGYFDGFNINLIVLIDHQIICKHVGEVNRSVPLIKARRLLSNNELRLQARTRVNENFKYVCRIPRHLH